MSGRTYEGQELGDDAIRARTADGQLVIIDISAVFRIDADPGGGAAPRMAAPLYRRIYPPRSAGVLCVARRRGFRVDDINSHKRKAFETALNELTREHWSRFGHPIPT